MVKAFIRMVEVFLALTLMFTVLSTLQIHNLPRYTDPQNTARLQDVARAIALSCKIDRESIIQNQNPSQNFTSLIPGDVGYTISIYSTTGTRLNTTGTPPENHTLVTYSLLMSGSIRSLEPKNYTYNPKKLVVTTWNK